MNILLLIVSLFVATAFPILVVAGIECGFFGALFGTRRRSPGSVGKSGSISLLPGVCLNKTLNLGWPLKKRLPQVPSNAKRQGANV